MIEKRTKDELRMLQAMPLDVKVRLTEDRIRAWVNEFGEDGVCISFSGGKDSTVLLHLVRNLYPNVRAVFSNTGLEYPEIRQFAMKHDNVDMVYPEIGFKDVITQYGYPLISKEVAEAIYYARRIGGGYTQGQRGRTSEQKLRELWSTDKLLCAKESDPHGQTQGETNRWYAYKPGKRRRYELQGFRTGVTMETIFDRPSQFNKAKYLPIARDLPIKVSHLCCNKLKKAPMHKYQKVNDYMPILGTMAEESRVREQGWLRTGCNAFDSKDPKSQPMSFWTNQDVLQYIVQNGIEICSVYGDIVMVGEDGHEYPPINLIGECGKLKCTGCDRTGCIYCAFGFHNEKGETRFQRLAKTHPKQYEFALRGGQWVDNPDYDPTAPKMDGDWQNWNPKKIWVPGNGGLGLGKVFEMTNEIMGKNFYRWE